MIMPETRIEAIEEYFRPKGWELVGVFVHREQAEDNVWFADALVRLTKIDGKTRWASARLHGGPNTAPVCSRFIGTETRHQAEDRFIHSVSVGATASGHRARMKLVNWKD